MAQVGHKRAVRTASIVAEGRPVVRETVIEDTHKQADQLGFGLMREKQIAVVQELQLHLLQHQDHRPAQRIFCLSFPLKVQRLVQVRVRHRRLAAELDPADPP